MPPEPESDMPVMDVFLSHNSRDKPLVEELARRLLNMGVTPWLDIWNLIPGEPWQEAIEAALNRWRGMCNMHWQWRVWTVAERRNAGGNRSKGQESLVN